MNNWRIQVYSLFVFRIFLPGNNEFSSSQQSDATGSTRGKKGKVRYNDFPSMISRLLCLHSPSLGTHAGTVCMQKKKV